MSRQRLWRSRRPANRGQVAATASDVGRSRLAGSPGLASRPQDDALLDPRPQRCARANDGSHAEAMCLSSAVKRNLSPAVRSSFYVRMRCGRSVPVRPRDFGRSWGSRHSDRQRVPLGAVVGAHLGSSPALTTSSGSYTAQQTWPPYFQRMGLILFIIGLVVSYWIIRLGVSHGVGDALRQRDLDATLLDE